MECFIFQWPCLDLCAELDGWRNPDKMNSILTIVRLRRLDKENRFELGRRRMGRGKAAAFKAP